MGQTLDNFRILGKSIRQYDWDKLLDNVRILGHIIRNYPILKQSILGNISILEETQFRKLGHFIRHLLEHWDTSVDIC